MSEKKLSDWIQDHLDRYIASDGEDGHMWNGLPTLLLTTQGRQSGEPRQLPLIYGEHEGTYIVVASKGGHSHHPSWYLNLDANPDVELQIKGERFKANARTARGDERAKLWELMSSIFPTYVEYQARADAREIPVVVCERV